MNEQIEAIRNEIKRRMEKHWDLLPDADSPEDDWTHNELCELGAYKELEHLETFIDSLPEETAPKGYDEAYLNECIAKARKTWEGVDVDNYMDEVRGNRPDSSDSLEEAASEYISAYYAIHHREPDMTSLFVAGAQWQKDRINIDISKQVAAAYQLGVKDKEEQMMKEAVETELYLDGDFLAIDLNMAALGYSERDKVRVIIVKEDNQ